LARLSTGKEAGRRQDQGRHAAGDQGGHMNAHLALQAALRAAFTTSAGVLALVPAANVLDRHLRPPPSPSVIIGEVDGGLDAGNVGRDRFEVFADVHVWVAELSSEGCKRILGELQRCLTLDPRPDLGGGLHLADWHVQRFRLLRDPSGDTSHGVMTVRAIIGGWL
jgi:hypothetical protein